MRWSKSGFQTLFIAIQLMVFFLLHFLILCPFVPHLIILIPWFSVFQVLTLKTITHLKKYTTYSPQSSCYPHVVISSCNSKAFCAKIFCLMPISHWPYHCQTLFPPSCSSHVLKLPKDQWFPPSLFLSGMLSIPHHLPSTIWKTSLHGKTHLQALPCFPLKFCTVT